MLRQIIVLDDDPRIHSVIAKLFEPDFVTVQGCLEVAEAAQFIATATDESLFVVDLMLLGDRGEELSNSFVLEELEPRGLNFVRISSEPELIPENAWGILPPISKRRLSIELPEFRTVILKMYAG